MASTAPTEDAVLEQPLLQQHETLVSQSTTEDEEDVGLVLVDSCDEEGTGEDEQSKLLQAVMLFAFTINYIFGAGVLGIPYAVAHGGIVVSSLLLVVSSALGLMGMVFVLEAQERANEYRGTEGVVEYSEICRLFIGSRTQRVYEVALTIFVICSAWMYAAIFSVSMAKTLPVMSDATECDLSSLKGPLWGAPHIECWYDYLLYLAVFSMLMFVLVQTDLAKMQNLQLLFTCVGLSALFAMMATVAIAIPEDGFARIDTRTETFNPAGFGAVFSSFVFAQLCHHGVPLLSHLPKRREVVQPVFVGVISTTTVLYLLLGIMCALFFGVQDDEPDRKPVNKLITINWQEYTAGSMKAGFFSDAISYFVRLYPAVTCGAAFPLYIITLGNGWCNAFNGSDALGVDSRGSRNKFYLAAMALSVGLASVMADVESMLFFVGMSAFIIAFLIPPLMQLYSLRMVPSAKATRYTWFFSAPFFCYVTLVFGAVAFTYTLVNQVFL